ncbi:hypothetical protein [Type-D symbiont of Plautia stali]|uniref:hypothetical protein n=1 Tax=Type-D symbiont of Plautia stali TaxID=1560356 RepID=UPI00073E713A|nr:hypothetical protein [Type-D symbiont of Plautia stali]
MKKSLIALAVLLLAGCARPYGPVAGTVNDQLTKSDPSKQQTKIKVLRLTQFRDSLFNLCTFDFSVDGKLVAFLRQNNYVTVYLDHGMHYLSYTYSCDEGRPYAQKVLEVITNGMPQEYSAKIGAFGQLFMWRTS